MKLRSLRLRKLIMRPLRRAALRAGTACRGAPAALDWLIFTLAPVWGGRRLRARKSHALAERRLDLISRAWEGAENDRHRGHGWLASKLSPDSALEQDLTSLRERSNDLFRNNPWVASYVNGLVSYVVGCGSKPQARIAPLEGLLDEQDAARHNAELEDVFARWKRQAGAMGETYAQLQAQMVRNRAVDGESFAVIRNIGSADRPLPMAIEIIAADRCETPPEQAANANVRLGIERDPTGRVVAYYFRRTHSGDSHKLDLSYERVPAFDEAGRPRVLHHFKRLWPGQTRGVPDVAPVLSRLKDLEDYNFAELVRMQTQACFAAFALDDSDPDERADAAATVEDSQGKRIEEISPGMIAYLRNGAEIKFAQPGASGVTIDPFMQWQLRGIAAALQFPYELLVYHWANSYSGGRLALINGHKRFTCDQQLLDEQFNGPVWQHLVGLSLLVAKELADDEAELSVDPRLYNRIPCHFAAVDWISEPFPWIDPDKEVEGAAKRYALQLDTLQNILAERGLDIEQFIAQRKREKQLLLEAGLPELIPAGWTAAGDGASADGKPPNRQQQRQAEKERDDDSERHEPQQELACAL